MPVDTHPVTTSGLLLPPIAAPVIIDGYANASTGATANTLPSGSNAALKVYLNGTNAGSSAFALTIAPGGSGSTIRGLVIGNFGGGGILLDASSNNTITGNFIGVTFTGNATAGNGAQGNGGGVNAMADAARETANKIIGTNRILRHQHEWRQQREVAGHLRHCQRQTSSVHLLEQVRYRVRFCWCSRSSNADEV